MWVLVIELTQVFRLGSKCLYMLSHLAILKYDFLSVNAHKIIIMEEKVSLSGLLGQGQITAA